jgi:hypothetical protein
MKSNMISISLFSFVTAIPVCFAPKSIPMYIFDEYTHVSPLLIKVCLPSPMLSTLRNVVDCSYPSELFTEPRKCYKLGNHS